MTDEEGRVHWRARYKTWGNLALQEQPQAQDDRFAQPALEEQNLRLQGQYFDAETGLCYNTFRYYDPDCGRFICQDPIGLAGGLNLYQFAPNAIGWIDPWGWAGNPATATHVTYRGIDAATGKPYIGYASMQGNQAAIDVVKYRYGGDYSRFGGQAPEVLYEGYGKNGKATARGLEQHYFKEAGGLKGTANKQNPVGKNNPRRKLYARKAAAHLKPKTNSTSRC
ncbi:MAG: RHS repeat-associated core domain-containing protein [Ideonella sp. MAG2]|nr:MAG: RHS repeat-associated core domain-containing protein [Ideonella sp. MAG2]